MAQFVDINVGVQLEDGDDWDALSDYVMSAVCRFFGQDDCSEAKDCPRMWVGGVRLSDGDEEE